MMTAVTKRITTSTTTVAIATGCVLYQVVITCSSGTAWTLAIQDKTAPDPFIWIPAFTLSVPVDGYPNVIANFEFPLPMTDGIDIVTAGGTGAVCVSLVINN